MPATRRAGPTRRRWLLAAAAVALLLAAGVSTALVISSSSHAPTSTQARPLTADEANRLAVVRFRNYQASGVGFTASAPSTAGSLPLVGFLNFRTHLGYAGTRIAGPRGTQSAVLQWNLARVAVWLGAGSADAPTATLPSVTPSVRALSPAQSGLDTVLSVLLNLGSDRPDNAQLLQQSDARWLGHDTIDGVPVDVLSGPSGNGANSSTAAPRRSTGAAGAGEPSTRYWVDADGRLLRFEASISGADVAVAFDRSGYRAFPQSPALVGK